MRKGHTVRKFTGLFLITMIGLMLSSCASMAGYSNNAPGNVPIIKKDIQVMGTVKVKYTSHGILGIIPEISLISWGDKSSYVALLDEAKKLGADDVVNLKVDLVSSRVLFFYNERTWVATGLAIKYLAGVPRQPDLNN
jgi:hypothetical protein